MGERIIAIDQYISKAQPFAQPILNYLRELIHEVCPGVEEKIRWGFPHFDYKGEMMCNMAAFKKHCAFGFWKPTLMSDPKLVENAKEETAMGHLGKITSLKDLPTKAQLKKYIQEAMLLNEQGIKVIKEKKPAKVLTVPTDFKNALVKNKTAQKIFDAFSTSAKNDYIEWIVEAKTEATRNKRMAQAIEWIAEGKRRNWKYEK